MKIKMLFLFALSLMFSCSKDREPQIDCTTSILQSLDMVAYTGQEIGCNTHVSLYHLRNKQYFLLDNFCADMVSYPTDCEGFKLCEESNFTCEYFYDSATLIGIVGIQE